MSLICAVLLAYFIKLCYTTGLFAAHLESSCNCCIVIGCELHVNVILLINNVKLIISLIMCNFNSHLKVKSEWLHLRWSMPNWFSVDCQLSLVSWFNWLRASILWRCLQTDCSLFDINQFCESRDVESGHVTSSLAVEWRDHCACAGRRQCLQLKLGYRLSMLSFW